MNGNAENASIGPGPLTMEQVGDLEARFLALVQSPLRAGLLRFFNARSTESFDIDALMQTFGRMRLDVENCVRELVAFGFARPVTAGGTVRYTFSVPEGDLARELLHRFLEQRAATTNEDRSPAVQRFREMLGRDEKMLVTLEWIRTAAKSDIAVLIIGATGTGKEIVARMIHELSRRSANRLQAVNCAALPDALFESELFGYEKGAFTGALERKPGRLELANGGTLFLDEIGDLSPSAQAKVLRALDERRFERLGGNEAVTVDFRLVSATNRPLEQLVRDGRFREDLYYRVNAFAIRLPSLQERAADIPILAQRFLARHCAASGLAADAKVFSRDAVDVLTRYHWPGNVRELESTISRAALSAPGRLIRVEDLDPLHVNGTRATRERIPTLAEAEKAHISRVLNAVNWNKKQAAELLAISRGTLYRKIVEYGLEADGGASHGRTREA